MSEELATVVHAETGLFSFQPRNLDEQLRCCELIARSEMCPKSYIGKPGNVFMAWQWGARFGLDVFQSMDGLAPISGKMVAYGDLPLAIVRRSGKIEIFEERNPAEALAAGEGWCRTKRIDRKGDPIVRTFSVDEAKKARLWSKPGPWQDYPGRQLMFRARSWALRDEYGDVLKGLVQAEEVDDYQEIGTTPQGHTILRPRRKNEAASSEETGDPIAAMEAFARDVQSTMPQAGPTQVAAQTAPATAQPASPLSWEGELEHVEEKKWEKGGKSGAFHVLHGGGKKFATFDTKAAADAKLACENLMKVRIEYEEGKYGPKLLSIAPVPDSAAEPEAEAQP